MLAWIILFAAWSGVITFVGFIFNWQYKGFLSWVFFVSFCVFCVSVLGFLVWLSAQFLIYMNAWPFVPQ